MSEDNQLIINDLLTNLNIKDVDSPSYKKNNNKDENNQEALHFSVCSTGKHWAHVVSDEIANRNFSIKLETPESAAKIWTKIKDTDDFCGGNISKNYLTLAWESFIERDYDQFYHLLSIKEHHELVGFSFWRDIHPQVF